MTRKALYFVKINDVKHFLLICYPKSTDFPEKLIPTRIALSLQGLTIVLAFLPSIRNLYLLMLSKYRVDSTDVYKV